MYPRYPDGGKVRSADFVLFALHRSICRHIEDRFNQGELDEEHYLEAIQEFVECRNNPTYLLHKKGKQILLYGLLFCVISVLVLVLVS